MIVLPQFLTIFAIAFNGIFFKFGDYNLNTERMLVPVIVLALATYMLANRPIFVSRSAWFYLGWAISVILSTLFSSSPVKHINGLLVSVGPVVYCLLFMQNGLSRRQINGLLEGALWVLSIASLLVLILLPYTGNAWKMLDSYGRTQLTLPEANILGCTLATLMVMNLGSGRISFRIIVLQVLSVVALVLTASKTPYVAYVAAIIYLLFRSGMLRRGPVLMLSVLGVIALVFVGAIFADSFLNFYQTALDRQDAISARMFTFTIAWERFLQHPIFGNGPLDFAFVNPEILEQLGTSDPRNLWIGQIWLAILHDEGVFGLLLFAAFLVATWIRCERLIRTGERQYLGYVAGMVVVLVACQATTVHLSAIFGLVVGLANSRPQGLAALRTTLGRPLATRLRWEVADEKQAPAMVDRRSSRLS